MCVNFENPKFKKSLQKPKSLKGLILEDKNPEPVFPNAPCQVLLADFEPVTLQFGLDVTWSKRPVVNARIETVEQKETFRPLLSRRCLVACQRYYEWRTDEFGQKHKNNISDTGGDILWIAGLFHEDQMVILTRAAQKDVAHIHGRMPFFVTPDHFGDWWGSNKPFSQIKSGTVQLKTHEITKEKPQMDLFQ